MFLFNGRVDGDDIGAERTNKQTNKQTNNSFTTSKEENGKEKKTELERKGKAVYDSSGLKHKTIQNKREREGFVIFPVRLSTT